MGRFLVGNIVLFRIFEKLVRIFAGGILRFKVQMVLAVTTVTIPSHGRFRFSDKMRSFSDFERIHGFREDSRFLRRFTIFERFHGFREDHGF